MITDRPKKCLISALVTSVMLCSTGVNAATLDIKKITVNKKLVTVEVSCSSDVEKVSMKAIKNDISGMLMNTYAVGQANVSDGKCRFEFEIPEKRNGEASTGEYTVYVRSAQTEKAEKTFSYVSEEDELEFLNELKNADAEISGNSEEEIKQSAKEKYSPLFSEQNKKILNVMGIDLDLFNSMLETVRENTYYLIHTSGIKTADIEKAEHILRYSFGMSVFENGEKVKSVKIIKPEYSDSQAKEIVSYMQNTYTDLESFTDGFIMAEQFYDINNARFDNVIEKIDALSYVSKIDDALSKIRKLSAINQNKATEYIVSALRKSPVKNADALEKVLTDAYKEATKSADSATGGGGSSLSRGNTNSDYIYVNDEEIKNESEKTQEATCPFNDIAATHFAYDSVMWCYDKKIVNGDGNGAFNPERNVTREEFVKMIVSATEISVPEKKTVFSDVISESWYEKYISAAYENGIIKGISEDKFGVGENVTREDMYVIALRAAKYKNIEFTKIREYNGFTDENEISSYAFESVKALYEFGVVNGRGNDILAPKAFATRAEAAKIIYEIFGEER